MTLGDLYIVTGLRLHNDESMMIVQMEPWDEPIENPNYSNMEDLKRKLVPSNDPAAAGFLTSMLSSFMGPPSLKLLHSPDLNVIMALPRASLEHDHITIGTKVQLHISKFEE